MSMEKMENFFDEDSKRFINILEFIRTCNSGEFLSLQFAMQERKKYREKWWSLMPYISFPPEWEVKLIPSIFPDLRLNIKRKNDREAKVSVIFETGEKFEHPLINDVPAWEVFPLIEIGRQIEVWPKYCRMNDIDSLLKLINEVLELKESDNARER